MTTHVLITHVGPDHKDISVQTFNPGNQQEYSRVRLKIGQYREFSVYDSQSLRIDEIPKEE